MDSKEDFERKISELIEKERSWTCGTNSRDIYARNNKRRHDVTLDVCRKYIPNGNSQLDIGRIDLTGLLSNYYNDVFSLGLDLEEDDGGHRENTEIRNVPHIIFDLNESKSITSWPDYRGSFDLITFCETMEHLYTAPEYVLLLLKYLLRPKGYIILTTPNAASFRDWLILCLGKNPAEKIRFYHLNPGHYRQYTKSEIIEIANNCELRTVESRNIIFYTSNYFVIRLVQRTPQLRDSIFAVLSH